MVARLTADTSGFYRAMAVANASMIRSGGIISRVAAGAGLAVLGMGFVAVRAAGNFQQSMNMVQATSGATTKQLGSLSKKALELGRDFKLPNVSAKDAADAMVQLGKAGFNTNQILKATRGVLQLGLAANISFGDAANITARALKAFNLEAKDSSRVANLFAAAANKSTAEVTDLAYGFQNASGQFQGAGYSIETLTTALTVLVDKGLSGEYAGTALKTMLIRLQGPTAKAAAEMNRLGISVYDAQGKMRPLPVIIGQFADAFKGATDKQREQALITIFGVRANQAMAKLLQGGVPIWEKYAKAVTNTNAAQKMAEARTKGFNGAMQAIGSAVETLAIQLGTALLPSLEKAARGFANFVNDIDPNKVIAVFTVAFNGVKAVIQGFVGVLKTGFGQQIAIAAVGTYALVKALGAARIATALLNTAFMAITRNPLFLALIPLGYLVGTLTMNFLKNKIAAMQLEQALREAAGGADALKGSLDALKASETGLEGAKLGLVRANMALKVAETAWQKQIATGKKGTDAYKDAYLTYREALNAVRAAKDGLTAAEANHNAKQKERNDLLLKGQNLLFSLSKDLQVLNGTFKQSEAIDKFTKAIKKVEDGARKTSAELLKTDPAASRAKAKLAFLADTAVDLAQKLGKVPTKKEIIAEAKTKNFPQFYQELLTAQTKMKAMQKAASTAGWTTGANLGAGLVSGIRAKIGEIEAAAQAAGLAAIAALNFASGTHSESTKTHETGLNLGRGLISGFLLGTRDLPEKMDEVLRKTLEAARTRIQDMQSEMSSMFSRLSGDIMSAFDAQTEQMKTKSEKLLDALFAKESADAAKKRLQDARDNIKQATQEIRDYLADQARLQLEAQQKYQEELARIQQQEAKGDLTPAEAAAKRAEAAKELADKEADLARESGERLIDLRKTLADARQALEDEKDAQALEKKKQALTKAAEEERKQLVARRNLKKRHLEDELADLEQKLARHPERHRFYQNKIIALLRSYGITYRAAGLALGNAFARGLEESLGAVIRAADKIAKAVADRIKGSSPTKEGPLSRFDPKDAGYDFVSSYAKGMTAAMPRVNQSFLGIIPAGSTMPVNQQQDFHSTAIASTPTPPIHIENMHVRDDHDIELIAARVAQRLSLR
jgi:TP901 family phage tail tape measure protein